MKMIQKTKILDKKMTINNTEYILYICKFKEDRYNIIFNFRLKPVATWIKFDFNKYCAEFEISKAKPNAPAK